VTFSNKVLKIHSDAHSHGVSELNAQALTAFRVVKTQSENIFSLQVQGSLRRQKEDAL